MKILIRLASKQADGIIAALKRRIVSENKWNIATAGIVIAVFLLAASKAIAVDYSAIEAAVRQQNFARIDQMIQGGGGNDSETAALFMVAAARAANHRVLEHLLGAGISIEITPNRGSAAGENALIHAACTGGEETVDFLLKHGAKANFIGHCASDECRGHTALVGAVNFRSAGITRKLLAAGADPNAADGLAMKLADEAGEVELYRLLLSYGGKEPPNPNKPAVPLSQTTANALPFQLLDLTDVGTTNIPLDSLSAGKRWRIAVIADSPNLDAADVLVAQLSAQPSIEVLERQELNRVLAEQKFSRQYALDEANSRIMADLLHADAILLVRQRDYVGLSLLEYRLVLARSGVVVDTANRTAPLNNKQSWAKMVSWRVTEILHRTAAKTAIGLSVREFQSVLPSEKAQNLARMLDVLFRDIMVHDPRFVFLERVEMNKLAFEAGETSCFQGGIWMIDPSLDLSVDKSGSFNLALRMQAIKSGQEFAIKVDGNITNLAGTVEALKTAVESQLGLKPTPPPASTDVEAEHYLSEAVWALQIGLPETAQTWADTAWSLGLKTLDVARLRVSSAIQSVFWRYNWQDNHDGAEKAASIARRLDSAIHATTIWHDTLLSEQLQGNAQSLRAWLESLPELEKAVKLAIASVVTSHDQIDAAEKLDDLRRAYWSALSDALRYSQSQPPECGLVNMISAAQANDARQMLQNQQELIPALRDIFSRHYPTNDTLTRSSIRAQFSWDRTRINNDFTSKGGVRMPLNLAGLPRELSAKKQFINELRSSPSAEDQFRAAILECDRNATCLSPPEAVSLMEHFWAMRDAIATNGLMLKPYYDRFDSLIENEPMGENGYTPRIYTLSLPRDGATNATPSQITQFEFRRQLYIYLLEHAVTPQPEFQVLMNRGVRTFNQDQVAEVQQAFQGYLNRTKASGTAFPARNQMPMMASTSSKTITQKPLHVQQLWHPFDLGLNLYPDFRIQPSGMRWAEGKIWLYGYAESSITAPAEPQHFIFAVDPLSRRTEAYFVPTNIPNFMPQAECMFELSSNFILVGTSDFFAVYDRRTKEWDTYSDIKPGGLVMDSEPGREIAYMIVENNTAVISFDMKGRTSRLLASTHRHPAEGSLDDPTSMIKRIWKNDAGKILVSTRKINPQEAVHTSDRVFEWLPTGGAWQPTQASPRPPGWPPEQSLAIAAYNVTLGRRVEGVGSAGIRIFRLSPKYSNREILLNFDFSLADALPWNRFGRQNLDFPNMPILACPAGYIICAWPGAAFWFIPKPEFDEYLKNVGN